MLADARWQRQLLSLFESPDSCEATYRALLRRLAEFDAPSAALLSVVVPLSQQPQRRRKRSEAIVALRVTQLLLAHLSSYPPGLCVCVCVCVCVCFFCRVSFEAIDLFYLLAHVRPRIAASNSTSGHFACLSRARIGRDGTCFVVYCTFV